jgi:secernin
MADATRCISCDTLVAFTGNGGDRRVFFAKNSDRPWREAQPLTFVAGARHAAGSTVRCQSLTIPQAEHTLAVLGSRPWWLWGFEHGLNEAGVAIGNEAVYTRDEVPAVGLLGMDLVRLGLERGTTAAAARQVITDHAERYGQGGAATYRKDFRYHSSFLIADADEAFVLETSGHRWVSKRVTSSTAISNLLTIADDWDDSSPDVEEYAREQGWWSEPRHSKLDWRRAYEDEAMRGRTEPRYAQSCRFLGGDGIEIGAMMRHLRDHFEGGTVHIPASPAEMIRPASICLHPEARVEGTTASMVVDLTAARREPVAFCSMSTPCTGVFVPLAVGEPSLAWSVAGEEADERSLWWSMHDLAERVQANSPSFMPVVQAAWSEWERELIAETYADPSSAGRLADQRTAALLERRADLLEQLSAVDAAATSASGRS